MTQLYRVTYNQWYLDREQCHDFRDEVTYVRSVSAEAAVAYVSERKRTDVVATPIADDNAGYLRWRSDDY